MRRFFISYVSIDRAWAFWIARELREWGYTVHLNETSFCAATRLSRIKRRVQAGHSVLIVLSKAYLARYDLLAKAQDVIGRHDAHYDRRDAILYVSIDSSRRSDEKARFCEISGIPESWARMRLKQFLAERVMIWPATGEPATMVTHHAG